MLPSAVPGSSLRFSSWCAVLGRACVLTLGLPLLALANQGQEKLPTVTLGAGMHNIVAEVAQTPPQRAKGLMYRTEMAPHEGMLFVFDAPKVQCFWMVNTLIPLSIAFLADDGTVVNIADMQPRSPMSHCSAKAVRFALEMNQGWFERRAIVPGSRLRGDVFQQAR